MNWGWRSLGFALMVAGACIVAWVAYTALWIVTQSAWGVGDSIMLTIVTLLGLGLFGLGSWIWRKNGARVPWILRMIVAGGCVFNGLPQMLYGVWALITRTPLALDPPASDWRAKALFTLVGGFCTVLGLRTLLRGRREA